MIRTLRNAAIATALLLAAGNAWALGLGQIEVKSRRNQPLLAEIPIVSTTPGELEALQARLASPETFRRVGLSPPTGIAADLQFSLGNDARGRPVIRVTTLRPVDQAVLNFLIEVDWGQGRLVREYSALVDAPNTASAPVQPAIEAPVAPAPNTVQRPQPAPPVATAPLPPPAQPVAQPPAPVPQPAAPAAEPPPAAVAIAPLPPTRSVEAAPPAEASRQYGPIRQGETLSKIAGGLGLTQGYSLDQAMLALLRANPDAFLGDDVNRLKRGAVLRVPGRGEVGQVDAAQASQVVREQMQQWRQARRAVRQPETASASPRAQAAAPAATAEPAAPAPAKPASVRPARVAAAPKPRTAAPRANEARLQIIPPTAPGKASGTRSGTAAGGEGSMLQQQLRQKDEEIASKSAEIGELKERVAELEKMRQDQQQLLSLKDSELAAAQQRLADANKAAAAAATKPAAQAVQPAQAAPAPAASTQQEPQPPAPSPTPYLWGGIGVVALGVLAWLLLGRRKPAPPVRRSAFDSEALAASLVAPQRVDAEPEANVDGDVPEPQPAPYDPTPAAPAAVPVAGMQSDPPTIDLASVPPSATRIETPTWHSGWVKAAEPEPAPAPAAQPRFVPLEDPLPEPAAPPSADQRMKLARAFLDIGDDHSARQLLRELLDDKDPSMRNDAARMLRELG